MPSRGFIFLRIIPVIETQIVLTPFLTHNISALCQLMFSRAISVNIHIFKIFAKHIRVKRAFSARLPGSFLELKYLLIALLRALPGFLFRLLITAFLLAPVLVVAALPVLT